MLRFQAHIQLQRFAKNLVLIKRLSGANASRSNSQGLDVQLSVFSRSRKKKKKRKEVEMETEGETLGGRANDWERNARFRMKTDRRVRAEGCGEGEDKTGRGKTERGGLLSASSDRREADLRQQVLEDRETVPDARREKYIYKHQVVEERKLSRKWDSATDR